MPIEHPIQLLHVDDWRSEFTETADGNLRIVVTAPSGRMWATERPTMEEAIALSMRILAEQRAAQDTAQLDPPAAPATP